ncbi:MAG: S8 family peptidase [Reichenbachiella sp.]
MRRFLGFVLLMMMVHIGYGQTRTVYIKLDESIASTAFVVKNISKRQVENHKAVRGMQSVSIQKQIASNARQANTVESPFLKGIYVVVVNDGEVNDFIKTMKGYDNVLDIEEEPQLEILLVPNDEFISNQDYLTVIQAYEAWDITKGDSSIVIGVSDTGVDLDHEDLIGKSYLNSADPIDGIDNDANGYVDDYYGWDFGNDDNDPTYEDNGHGTNVTGVIAANTNNVIGVAGLAYNSKFMPLKVTRSDGVFFNAYTSILYAADMGCEVINISWGGVSSPSGILQSIIDYAVLEKDMVIVAAAGNTEADLDFYPASYNHVLSVGNVASTDHKANNATWSYHVDLMAPGISIFSTNIQDKYMYNNGSSFSSPIVASTAALVRSVHPEYSAIQVMEHVRMTTDDIYSVGNNMDYYGQLGKGRVNVLRAVSEQNVGAIRMYDQTVNSKFEDYIFAKDTVEIVVSLVNILRDMAGAKIIAESESSSLIFISQEAILGDLHSFDSVKNITFKAIVSEDAVADEQISIRLNYLDNEGYEDFEYLQVQIAPSFVILDNGFIRTTLASDGSIAYAGDSLKNGVGFSYKEEAYALQVGIAIGTHQDSIYDNIYSNIEYGIRDADFATESNVAFGLRDDVNIYARGVLKDTLFDGNSQLMIEQEYLLWESGDLQEVMIQEYFVSNVGDKDLEDVKMGYLIDLNLGSLSDDFVAWDSVNGMGYFYETESSLFAGVAFVSGHIGVLNALDMIDLPNLIDDELKHTMLNAVKTSAGGNSGQDVAQMMVTNISLLAVNQSEKIAMAIVFGQSLVDIQSRLSDAKTAYASFLTKPDLNLTKFTCENESIALNNDYVISLFEDPFGDVPVVSGTDLIIENVQKDSVLYYTDNLNGFESDLYQLFMGVSNPVVEFRADPAILYLGDDPDDAVQFVDESLGASEWAWSFSNGYFSSAKSPISFFHEEGDYEIALDIVTDLGCEASSGLTYAVVVRGTSPVLETSYEICAGENVSISSTSSDQLRFYFHDYDDQPFFEGASLELSSVLDDVIYYVSSYAETVESEKIPVAINVDPVTAIFEYAPDTTDLSSPEMIIMVNQSVNANTISWKLNDMEVGQDSTMTFDVSAIEELKIELIVTSEDGCISDRTISVLFSESTKAGINQNTPRYGCEWDYVHSNPIHGEVFAFFADATLQQLVAKGSSAKLGPVLSDTSFYIVNISDYHMSEPTELSIDLNVFNPILIADPDSLAVGQNPVVHMEASPQDEIAAYRWYLDDEFMEISSSVSFLFYEEGTYNVKTVLESIAGCQDTLRYDYEVYTPITLIANRGLDHDISLYPNPIGKDVFFSVSSTHTISSVKVFDHLGKMVMSKRGKTGRVDIPSTNLASGLYVVQVITPQGIEFIKVIKE